MSTIKVPAAAALGEAMAEADFWKNRALANAAWLHDARQENQNLKEEIGRLMRGKEIVPLEDRKAACREHGNKEITNGQ